MHKFMHFCYEVQTQQTERSSMATAKTTRSKKGLQRLPQSVSLDKTTIDKLEDMVEREGMTKSQVVDQMLKKQLEMEDDSDLPTILTFMNFKGGVAKTTSVSSLAVCLGELGKKVLIIDFDAQGNSSQTFNVYDVTKTAPCIVDVLFGQGMDHDKKTLDEVMMETDYKNVKVVPSNMRFLEADSYIRNEKTGADTLLKYAIQDLEERFDYIIIDCGPRLDMTITNALVAMEAGNRHSEVILPVKLDGYAIVGLPEVINTINNVGKSRRTKPQPWRILITVVEKNTNAYRLGLNELKETLPGAQYFETQISKGTLTNESSLAMMPLVAYDSTSQVARDYNTLALEIEAMNE